MITLNIEGKLQLEKGSLTLFGEGEPEVITFDSTLIKEWIQQQAVDISLVAQALNPMEWQREYVLLSPQTCAASKVVTLRRVSTGSFSLLTYPADTKMPNSRVIKQALPDGLNIAIPELEKLTLYLWMQT